MSSLKAPEEPEVHVITGARPPASADVTRRQRNYVIAMSLRVACFVAAVWAPVGEAGRGALIAGAILLPYFAVVAANQVSRTSSAGVRSPEPRASAAIGPPTSRPGQ